MPQLRWILIVAGALLLIGIYLWGRRGSRQAAAKASRDLRARPEPQFDAPSISGDSDAIEPYESREEDAIEPAKPAVDQFAITAMRPAAYRPEATVRAPPPAAPVSVDRLGSSGDGKDVRRARIEPTFGAESEHIET